MLSCIILAFFIPGHAVAQNSEIEGMAQHILKLSKFIEWPKNKSSYRPVVFFVIDNDSASYKIIKGVFTNRKIHNKEVKVFFSESAEVAQNCDIMYIAPSKTQDIDKIMNFVRSKPILTIGRSDEYLKKGVIVNFSNSKNEKIPFVINKRALTKSGIYIDAILLSEVKVIQ